MYIDITKEENLYAIRKMAEFRNGWDDNGGEAFSESAIRLFTSIVEALREQPRIAPTGRNSIVMQYELYDGSMLVFEVQEERTEKIFIPYGNYSLAESEIFVEDIIEKILDSVERFSRLENRYII